MNELGDNGPGSTWLGREAAFEGEGGGMWVGRHSGDDDLLIFDPREEDPGGDNISFYSLAKHRRRSFPRSFVESKIVRVTDEGSAARALEDYARRSEREAERDDAREADRSAQAEQLREAAITTHRHWVESQGLPYEGVERTDGNRKAGRRTKCVACGIALDDFAHAFCLGCSSVLCSCGACACGAVGRGR